MPLLSYDVAPTKGATSNATMDKSVLLALAAVSADAYWSNSDNTQTVIVTFKSTSGNQKKILTFDFTQVSPQAAMALPVHCRDSFTINKITMHDYLGDKMSIVAPGLNEDDIALV